MKLDIEGEEVDILENMADSDFAKVQQMTIEFHPHLFPTHVHRIGIIKRRLRALGFWVANFSSARDTDVVCLNSRYIRTDLSRCLAWIGYDKYARGLWRRFSRQFIPTRLVTA